MASLFEPGECGDDAYRGGPSAVLIAEGDAHAALRAIEGAGVRLRARIGFAEVEALLGEHSALDLIVIEAAGVPDALTDRVMARADAIARERQLCVVAAVTIEQVDAAAVHLLGPRTQLLCNPSSADRAAAMALACAQAAALEREARMAPAMDDARRDTEVVRLRRLNEEVARIADALARLTRGEEGERSNGVRDPGSDYRGPDNGQRADATPQEIRAVIRSRRLRAQFFAEELFADPAWDMLLDLYAADLEQRRVSVSSLCIAAAVPPTTALRWIGTLHEEALFERQADPSDRRRAYIALSEKGIEGMRSYIAAVKRQGLSLV
jgi:DNA-binding MarR family transcriptional regulator